MTSYDQDIHGTTAEFEILFYDIYTADDRFILFSGMLDATRQTTANVFIPYIADATGTATNLYLCARYQSGETGGIRFIADKNHLEDGWSLDTTYNKGTFAGLVSVFGMAQKTEPMDFSGANALYFWELFYYTPMMVFKRLLLESNFSEATRWLHYIWNPAGYLVDGEMQNYTWNVRPLEEETSWHANPLDSVDPDAVSQADPLHYKVATFMAWLDLLIARGDTAYRQLERDTLSEAKMWYMQALDILGDEPLSQLDAAWSNPTLSDAADETKQAQLQQALQSLHHQVSAGELQTANSLTSLFLPQQNEKLAG